MAPLSGLRIVDLSDSIAGAYTTKLFVDAGADVLKVEPPDGDPLRRWSRSRSGGSDGHPDGALFRHLCASKRSVAIDVRAEAGRDRVRRLAADADVLVETWEPGVLEELGLGPSVLHEDNPGLTVVSISPFGRLGPDSPLGANDFLLQARSGSLYSHGFAEPLTVPGELGQYAAAVAAAAAALAVRWGALRTGRGHHVDVSILEAQAITLLNVPNLTARLRPGGTPTRTIPEPVPGIERCSDGWVGFTTVTSEQWLTFLAMIERPDLQEDLSLCDGRVRTARIDEMRTAIRGWTQSRTVAEVVELAGLFRIPSAPVLDGASLPSFEQAVKRQTYSTASVTGARTPRSMFRWSRSSDVDLRPAPTLDADTAAWLSGHRRSNPVLLSGEPAEPRARADRPLAGIRVLDFSAFWSGPTGTGALAALGADVIKVESVQRPDPLRFNGFQPKTTDQWWEYGGLANALNPGKRDITLNLADPRGRDLALRLAMTADIVIENFTPRVMESFKLTYDDFAAVRPDIIMLRCPAFGLDGPWRDRTGFAPTVEQISGLAFTTGNAGGEPMMANGYFDPVAGMHYAFAALAALEHRRRTGEGQLVEISMFEVAANITAELVLEYDAYGELLTREGNRSRNAAPQGVYDCRGEESWLALSVQTDEQWQSLAGVLGRNDLARRPDLATVEGRWSAHDELDAAIGAWCADRNAMQVCADLAAAGVRAAPVVAAPLIEDDPQMVARGFWQDVDHPLAGRLRIAGFPFVIDKPWEWYWRHAPLLGQDNDEVLAELGCTQHERDELLRDQVIGTRLAVS